MVNSLVLTSHGNIKGPAFLNTSDLKAVAQNLKQNEGKTAGDKEIVNAIVQKQEERAIQQGLVPITTMGICPDQKTIRNYKSLMASLPDISVIRNAVPKPQTRFTAENSWMSSVAFMILVAATHFIPLWTKSHQYEEQQKRLKEASAGAKKLFSLVLKANFNMPLFVIRPPYNCSTDDTTTYTYVGEGQTKATFLLASRSALKSAGTCSKYKAEDSNAMQGLRVKLTFTFSQAGCVADTFVSIVGLTESELPKRTCPTGFLALDIKGLAVGGGGITVGEQKSGWLVFI